jgi:hypothetical protein
MEGEDVKREFIYVANFEKKWRRLHLDDSVLRLLENYIMENPDAAVIMQGTGGLRKLRWAFPGSGKSGGMRILYVDFVYYDKIFVVDVFTKTEKDNLTDAEKNAVKQSIQLLEKELKNL